jgi:hypothetical protein
VTINPLLSARIDDPKSPWAGIWIAEDIELISQRVRSNSWVDGALGVVGLDALDLTTGSALPMSGIPRTASGSGSPGATSVSTGSISPRGHSRGCADGLLRRDR